MGRTIASITQTWQQEEAALRRFQRALRKEDQALLDELLVMSHLHIAEASYASNLYPMDMYLISILLEVYKQLKATQNKLAYETKNAGAARVLLEQEKFRELLQATSVSPSEETRLAPAPTIHPAPKHSGLSEHSSYVRHSASDAHESHPDGNASPAYTDFEEAP